MKRYVLLLVIAAGITSASFAQTKEKDDKEDKEKGNRKIEVPANVKSAFNKQFSNATKVKWEKEDANYEVNFKQGANEMSAVYTSGGMLDETEIEIEKAQLPDNAVNYVKQHYKRAKIKEAAKITRANGEVNYEAQIKGMDLIFDASGNFIREVKI